LDTLLQPSEPAATVALGGGEDLASAEGEVFGTIPSPLVASMKDVGEGEGELLTGVEDSRTSSFLLLHLLWLLVEDISFS
jgi:hypothetical protein